MIRPVLQTSIPHVSHEPLSSARMREIKSGRLRAAREKAGYPSAADAARAFGWTESAYRHHENGTRAFGADAASRYGRAFKTNPGWLLGLENVDSGPPARSQQDDRLVVNGSVEAGVWRASEAWDDERTFVIEGIPSPVPDAKRFGLVVVGRSMDEHYEPDTVLDCVSIFDTNVKPQTGDHVICQCIRPDGLRELTVKEYREEHGRYWLVPKSSNPKFEPVEYDGPDVEHNGDDQISVIGFVIAAYPPRSIDLLRRMGKITTA